MAWIEAHQDLRDHPKTKRAARMLGITRAQMIGHLMCLWWWCLDYAEDGDLSDFNSADIADASEWSGDPDAFVDALINCGPANRSGFLIESDGLQVNDWAEYGGKYITKRNQGRDRQRTYRQRNADITQDNADVTRYLSVSNTPREDKITEDKSTGIAAALPLTAPVKPKRERKAKPGKPEVPEQVKWFRSVIGRFPPKELYPQVIAVVDGRRDSELLSECWRSWIAAGYNRANYAWFLDWYKSGHVSRRNGSSSSVSAQSSAAPYVMNNIRELS